MRYPGKWREVIGTRFRALLLRVRFLLRRGTVERKLDEEFRFHLDRQIEENLGLGYSPAEARRRALVEFGGVDRLKEQVRDGRGTRLLEDMRRISGAPSANSGGLDCSPSPPSLRSPSGLGRTSPSSAS